MAVTAYEEKEISILYRIIRWFVWLFAPKFKLSGTENIPDEPCIFVGNHSQMYGPIVAELYTPGRHATWCVEEMMTRGEVADYAYKDFWSGKPRYIRWFFRLLSRIIDPLAVHIFGTNARTIPVYRDLRIAKTFRLTAEALTEGRNIVIFPECYTEHNNIVHEFQPNFADVARFYHRKTARDVAFVPTYIAPKLKTVYFGEPVRLDTAAPADEERERVVGTIMDRITDIAVSLPEHTVVPYPNIPRRRYPKNVPLVEAPSRPAGEPLQLRQPNLREVTGSPGRDVARDTYIWPHKAELLDYSGFSLSRLRDPRFSHMLLLGGWIVYFALYFITENLIPQERMHLVHGFLDDVIPFAEGFVIFYVSWFVLCVGALARTLFTNVDRFRRLQVFIMITQAVAMAIYIIWPNWQDLRPTTFPRQNLWTWILSIIYAFDTPTGVCPSLHVAYSMGILSVGLKDETLSKRAKAGLTVWIICICVSVCFVKQHSSIDVVAALPLALLAEALVYGKSYWLPKMRSGKTAA